MTHPMSSFPYWEAEALERNAKGLGQDPTAQEGPATEGGENSMVLAVKQGEEKADTFPEARGKRH